MTIQQNEKYINNQINNAIRNYESLNEDSGHPLFKYGDPEETFDWIGRIKNVIDVLNAKIDTGKVKNRYKITFKDENDTTCIYDELLPISISINKLGFKDVINAQKSTLKVVVNNVISGGNDFDEYMLLRDLSCGHCNWNITRKVINGKFVNTNDNSEIMYAKCWAINGKIIPISFLLVFLHEYLHYYEQYNRFNSDTIYSQYLNIRKIKKAKNNINAFYFSKEENEALNDLIYHLYVGEDNAKIGNLFSDLISLNITNLMEFNNYKRKMHSFYVYEQLKKNLDIVKKCDKETLANFIKSNTILISNKTINIDDHSDHQIVKKFIANLENKLNKFYERLMRFVGRYIYMQQQHENQTVTSIKQH